ncbi:MAG: hypothetical protein DMG77_19685 [Acidobacteria bacterium]|nr:MAG: hypothetical protein DMG77_19685 [Acidobacteriota bacterium]
MEKFGRRSLRAWAITRVVRGCKGVVVTIQSVRGVAMRKACTAVVWFLLFSALTAESRAQRTSGDLQPDLQSAPTAASANIDPAKEADIRRLMDLAGAKALGSQMMEGMGKNIKPMMTNALPPGEYREKLIDLFFVKFQTKADMQKLLDLIPNLRQVFFGCLIQFYQTPLGQKTLRVLPQLMAESQEAGRKWGEGLGRQSMLDVLPEHPELAKAVEDAQKGAHRG